MKEELQLLEDYIRAVKEHWPYNHHYTTMRVLVQNMKADGELTPTAIKCIRALKALNPNDHVVLHVNDTLDCLALAMENGAYDIEEPEVSPSAVAMSINGQNDYDLAKEQQKTNEQ